LILISAFEAVVMMIGGSGELDGAELQRGKEVVVALHPELELEVKPWQMGEAPIGTRGPPGFKGNSPEAVAGPGTKKPPVLPLGLSPFKAGETSQHGNRVVYGDVLGMASTGREESRPGDGINVPLGFTEMGSLSQADPSVLEVGLVTSSQS